MRKSLASLFIEEYYLLLEQEAAAGIASRGAPVTFIYPPGGMATIWESGPFQCRAARRAHDAQACLLLFLVSSSSDPATTKAAPVDTALSMCSLYTRPSKLDSSLYHVMV